MNYLLGIDLGTSSAKSLLLDENGAMCGIGQTAYDFETPQPGWAEQAPEVWWQAAQATIQQILHTTGVNPRDIRGIGFSGQMHGPVFLDQQGQSVRPAIIWADQRSVVECREIYATLGQAGLFRTVCNPVDSGFMAATLCWLKKHEPHSYRQIHTLLLPKDYLKYRLSGARVTDPSDAGGTSLYDVRARGWSAEVCTALQLAPEMLPLVVPSHEIIGVVSAAAAAETGLAEGTPLINGGSDQTMSALASGAIHEGPVMLVIGTGGTLFTTVDQVVVDPALRMHTYPHCVPAKWHLLGAILAGGLTLKWFRQIVGGPEAMSYEAMSTEAATVPPGAEGLLFLPYLAGERTPHMDSLARGVLFGLTLRHTRAHVIRAIMEGVGFAMRDCLTLFHGLQVTPQTILAGGGGASSPLWRQILADILNLPLRTIQTPEKSATGAAMIAGIGTGIFPDFERACQRVVAFGDSTLPVTAHVARYAEAYRVYTALYPRLKPSFQEDAALAGL